jgi:large subunit ribosomal protein L10
MRVAKNTLLRLAVKDTEYEVLTESFSGTTAITLCYDEPVGSAKALTDFAKGHEALAIRSAALDGKLLSGEDVLALSKLPSKEQLLGQLCGVLQAVPTGLVSALSGVPRNLVYALNAVKEQKEN